MRLGLFLIMPAPAGSAPGSVVERALADGSRAEELGFDAVWVTEHHGSDYGWCSAPSVMAGALAVRTRRVDIGYAVNVTPLHHPVRLAEEIATVDQLSRGRVIAGFGPGYSPVEYAPFDADFDDRHRLHERASAASSSTGAPRTGSVRYRRAAPRGGHRRIAAGGCLGGKERIRPAGPERRGSARGADSQLSPGGVGDRPGRRTPSGGRHARRRAGSGRPRRHSLDPQPPQPLGGPAATGRCPGGRVSPGASDRRHPASDRRGRGRACRERRG